VTEQRSGFVVLSEAGDHPDLAHWHGNIGDPIALELGAPLARNSNVLDVVTWNVAIGLGRLPEVVEKIRAGVFDGEKRPRTRPLIILVQEAYRADISVPEASKAGFTGGKQPTGVRSDIVDAANELGFSLRYAPSMRNGRHRSDRGNAVLSSVAVAHARAFPLPYVRQRRVAVAVELHGLPWLTLVSAHLDTRGRVRDTRATGRYASGRSAQAGALAERFAHEWGDDQTVVLGADLNTYFATREPLLRALVAAGFERVPHEPHRSHTFHAPPIRMLLDHIMIRAPSPTIASVRVLRLDEDARDHGRYIFGSDHHPLLARIDIAAPSRRRPKTS
jgi:endonuclease/exonuclease/phosphatase family metal-dependent hydrolase